MSFQNTPELIAGLQSHDWRALAKAITLTENDGDGKEELLTYAWQASREDCLLIGLTGAGGAGKSTLIDGIIQEYVKNGKRVGVIAVDPSSAYTGGAVLGDRVRMGKHAMDPNVFIRSFASRGALGGISQGAKDVLYLYKAFGFDVIIVESYGVGQAETDISEFVDVTVVVMAPGNGDHIQLAKAGTREVADIFVVNKADNPEAEALYAGLLDTVVTLPEGQRPAVLKTVARDRKGIKDLADQIACAGGRSIAERGTKKQIRIINEVYSGALRWFVPMLRQEAEKIADAVLKGEMTPYAAGKMLGKRITITSD